MKRIMTLMGLLVGAAFILGPTMSKAAMYGQNVSLEGTIIDISANVVTINQQSENQLREIEIHVNQDTDYQEVSSLDELHAGDRVQVEFFEQGDQRVAAKITKMNMENMDPDPSS
jgi:type 1 fimbria pilin